MHHKRSQSVFEEDEAEEVAEKGGWFHPPLGQRNVRIVRDLAPCNCFLFPKLKNKLAGGVPQRGDLQDQVGRGRRQPHQGRLHRVLRQVGEEALKVYSCCWFLC